MDDLHIVRSKTIIPIKRVTYLPLETPALRLEGRGLRYTDEVRINNAQAPDFTVMASNRIEVEIPASQLNEVIRTVAAYASTLRGKGNLLFFKIMPFASQKAVGGTSKTRYWRLIQRFIVEFLTDIGSYPKFQREGGARTIIGGNVVSSDASDIRGKMSLAVERTASRLREHQSQNNSLAKHERLLMASLESLEFDFGTGNGYATVRLLAEDGEDVEMSLGV